MYAQVLLAMLKRDLIEEPFSQQPESGPLPTMPPYMVNKEICQYLITTTWMNTYQMNKNVNWIIYNVVLC